MPDGITPADPGLLASLADQISLPGYALRNLIRGDFGAAGRNAADFGLNLADAALPGDLIPEISGDNDRPEFREVFGAPDGLLGEAVNFAGNVITDPLTFVPGAAVAKGFGAAGKVAKAVTPQAVQKGAAKVGKKIRRTFGAEKIGKPLKDVITKAQGAREVAGRSSGDAIVEGLKGASQRELDAAGEVLLNVTKDKTTGALRAIDESDTLSVQDRLARYVMENPDVSPEALQRIVDTSQRVAKGQWESGKAAGPGGNIFTDMAGQPDADVVMGALGGTTGQQGVQQYFPRIFQNADDADVPLEELLTSPNAIKGRKLETTKDVLAYLAENTNVKLTTNAAEALSKRASQQAELAARGATGKGLMDLARQSDMALPDELLAKVLPALRAETPRAVVTQGGGDVGQMLGGGAARSGPLDIYGIGSQSGKAKPPGASLAEDAGVTSRELYGVGEQSGKSAVGRSTSGEQVAPGLRDLGLGGQTGKSAVGQSAEAAATGLSDIQRKQARDWLLSREYKQADPLLRETAEAIAKNLPGDEADVALHMLKGMNKRGAVTEGLSKLNRYFKPYAVYGAVVPKLGSITRNLTGGLWQQFSNAEARGSVGQAALRLVPTWLKSIEDGVERLIGKRLFSKNEFAEVDAAFKASGGDPRKALELITDPDMRSAVERGVLGNNFVDTEQLIKSTQRGGWKALGGNILDYPGDMFKGAEQRMRYGLYKDLLKKGSSADDAARIVRESFYDYGISSAENRLVRDIIPFAQFMGKAIPQQAKLFAEKPALASAVANLYAPGRDEPVMPNMEGKVNIPIGTDEQGNRQFLSNLGLPFEALGVLPNLSANPLQAGRDIEQNIVGSSQPLLKAAYSYISGRDPYFGSMPGSYQKVAGQDLGSAGAIINQVLNSGVPFASAVTSPLGTVGKALDERTSLAEMAVNQLTGARVQTVDPDRAIQQRLQAYLERDPSIGQFRTFYDKGDDVVAQDMLAALKSAKDKLKQKQAAITPVN